MTAKTPYDSGVFDPESVEWPRQNFTIISGDTGSLNCPDCGIPLPSNRVALYDRDDPKKLICQACGERRLGMEPGTAQVDARLVNRCLSRIEGAQG